ncbi:MAG: CDP-alcohol phosphatidyltransferase [Sphingobacteriales bacterium]|nr:MAG: CDP-alcohol phosphatidyltransferase [Sphingobacteriales bacterium]
MRHLPNLLTLANLFCGCCAIALVLSAQNFSVTTDYEHFIEVPAVEQPWLGTIFIFLAAFFDLIDGAVARALRVSSPLGKDLDSLADVVSFGVAPSMILYKLLWAAWMRQPEAMDISLWATAPAFLIAVFAAYRLARFNHAPPQSGFTGMPTPAVGIAIAALPLVPLYGPQALANLLLRPWMLYALILALCYLMVSKIRFFKLSEHLKTPAKGWPAYLLIIGTLVLIPVLKGGSFLGAILLYALLSMVAPKTPETAEPAVV